MKVYLLEDVQGTGSAGDVVQVSDGYARNYLIPRKMAREVTAALEKELQQKKDSQARKRSESREAAADKAQRMKDLGVVIKAKIGENGKLFGSVLSKDIALALKEQHGITVDKKKIDLKVKISEPGVYEIKVHLYEGINSMLKVEVTPDD